jgi:L-threonylcarbamoyladenylate synthase
MATWLAAGEVALLPTDTLPALAAQPAHAARIWALKLRPLEKPLILMVADPNPLVQSLGGRWRQEWLEQASHSWPGPVTLVLPISGETSRSLNPTGASLGLRVPACAAIRDVLRLSGPLATTSVNRSGEPPARSRCEAVQLFPELPALAAAAWSEGSGVASTVLAWRAHGDTYSWQTLRAGARVVADIGQV